MTILVSMSIKSDALERRLHAVLAVEMLLNDALVLLLGARWQSALRSWTLVGC